MHLPHTIFNIICWNFKQFWIRIHELKFLASYLCRYSRQYRNIDFNWKTCTKIDSNSWIIIIIKMKYEKMCILFFIFSILPSGNFNVKNSRSFVNALRGAKTSNTLTSISTVNVQNKYEINACSFGLMTFTSRLPFKGKSLL